MNRRSFFQRLAVATGAAAIAPQLVYDDMGGYRPYFDRDTTTISAEEFADAVEMELELVKTDGVIYEYRTVVR